MGRAGPGVGTGAGNAEKHSSPQAVEWGRAGNGTGGRILGGPWRPNNVLYE